MPPASLLLEEPASALLFPAAAVAVCASAHCTQFVLSHNLTVPAWMSAAASSPDLSLSGGVKTLCLAMLGA